MGDENGLVGLLQQRVGLNPQIKMTAGGGGGGTVLNTKICANQSERATETRPREMDNWSWLARPGLEERCEAGTPGPMRCTGTDVSTEGGGGLYR